MDKIFVAADELCDTVYELCLLFIKAVGVKYSLTRYTALFSDCFKSTEVSKVELASFLSHKVVMTQIKESQLFIVLEYVEQDQELTSCHP